MKYKFGVSYFSSRMKEHFIKDLDEMVACGCNEILLTYNELDQEYYQEAMKEFVDLAHERSMFVYFGPWAVGSVFGGEAFSRYVGYYYEERQVLSNGDRPAMACLNNPHFRKFFTEWMKSAVYCGVDSIFFDEPHFFMPGWGNLYHRDQQDIWGCRCKHCQKLYTMVTGEPMPVEYTDEVKSFKRKSILDFITYGCQQAKKLNPEILTSVCLITNSDFLQTDLPFTLAGIEDLDEIGTDPYWGEKEGADLDEYIATDFADSCDILKKIEDDHQKKTHLWIKNFLVRNGTEEQMGKAIDLAVEKGMTNIMAWSYKGTKYMSKISCDNPDKVWEILTDKFKKYGK